MEINYSTPIITQREIPFTRANIIKYATRPAGSSLACFSEIYVLSLFNHLYINRVVHLSPETSRRDKTLIPTLICILKYQIKSLQTWKC